MAMLVPQIQEHMFFSMLVPLINEDIEEVTQLVPFERTQARVGEEIVAASVPQTKEDGVDATGARQSHAGADRGSGAPRWTPWTLWGSYHKSG